MHARSSLLAFVGVMCGASIALARTGYYQFPDLHDHAIVFASEGDLWTVSDSGGTARRITTHAGSEYFPRFSPAGKSTAVTGGGAARGIAPHAASDSFPRFPPEGKSIAFPGESGGTRAVYVIPAGGGEPR